jgi:hypothetical protein
LAPPPEVSGKILIWQTVDRSIGGFFYLGVAMIGAVMNARATSTGRGLLLCEGRYSPPGETSYGGP